MSKPLVSLRGIEKHFDDFVAVKNLDLTIEKGAVLARKAGRWGICRTQC